MNKKFLIATNYFFIATILILGFIGCQKMDRPALGKYLQDANPPGGPLKFYAAFDGTTSNPLMNAVDSIRANFPSANPFTSVAGISGKAVQGVSGMAINYPSANDFKYATSFTIAFWVKTTGVPKSADGPQFVFSLVQNNYSWHNSVIFLLFDHTGAGSTVDSAAISFALKDNWYVFHNGDRIPKLYDQQWHHLAFVYDETTSLLTTYADGKALVVSAAASSQTGVKGPLNFTTTDIANLVIGGWNTHAGLNGATGGWIQSYPGAIDQFRMYGKVLSASEIQSLYNNKQ